MKIRPVGAELLHPGRQTDARIEKEARAKLTVAFRNFANAPKNIPFLSPNTAGS